MHKGVTEMTEIEAHRIVSLFREELDKNSKMQNAHDLDVVTKALEKQIPKKPEMEKYTRRKLYFCPICGAEVTYCKYCPNCGQKIGMV